MVPPGFLKSVLVLITGTALGHIITAVALIFTTRLYSPEDFNIFAVFCSAVAILSVAAALRFDIAVSVAENDAEAVKLVQLALISTITFVAIVGAAALLVPSGFYGLVGLADIEPYILIVPLAILLTALYSMFQSWYVRKQEFPLIAKSRIAQSGITAGAQIGLGVVGWLPLGLLLGNLTNTGVGCFVLGRKFSGKRWKEFCSIKIKELTKSFVKYKKYPQYSTIESLANSASIQAPVIIIASLSIGPEAGYMMLAMTVMQAPMALVGTAVAQVYVSAAPQRYSEGTLSHFTINTLANLNKTATGPLIFAAVIAPEMFAFLFGEQWRRAGEIVAWMTPWFVMQFLASPLSMSIYVTGHQLVGMYLQVGGLVLRILFIFLGYYYLGGYLVESYAVSGFVFYLIYLTLILKLTGSSLRDTAKNLLPGLGIVLAWVLLACLAHVVIGMF